MNIKDLAIQSAQNSEFAFCKFITANDAGNTGAHQAGFHIAKEVWPMFFDIKGEKGKNKDRFIEIKWQNEIITESRFIYYGVGTRNEYRLTRFGRKFPFLNEENEGNLLVLARRGYDYFEGFVLSSDDDIEDFLAALNISAADTNKLIPKASIINPESTLVLCFLNYLESLQIDFPTTKELAITARSCYDNSFGIKESYILANPDKIILKWLQTEYELFKTIENKRYSSILSTPFKSVEQLISFANSILNRRKSRAGKSLEHHLENIFKSFQLNFSTQSITESNKKPDFLFPGQEAYHNPKFDTQKLIFLASKTTCKDRWRQILNEADRIKFKYLFTLQQGISKNQIEEMTRANVRLVVPSANIDSYPKESRVNILSLQNFLSLVENLQKTDISN